MATYIKPQVLNTKRASTSIMGSPKPAGHFDSELGTTASAYRSDEQ
jgi:hypothetical protein